MWNFILDTFGPLDQVSCGKLRTTGFSGLCGLCLVFGLCTQGNLFAQDAEGGSPAGEQRAEERPGRRGNRGGGRNGFDPTQMIGRLDQDQNGMITENEIENVPASIRQNWQEQGLDFRAGVRVDDLQQNAEQQMEELRRQGGGRGRNRNADRAESTPPEDLSRSAAAVTGPPSLGGPTPAPAITRKSPAPASRSRVSPLLPESFQSFDTDLDGQIALSEWRKGKRGTLSQFAQYDLDGDGFLIAKELAKVASAAVPPAPGTAPTPATSAVTTSTPASPTIPSAPVAVSAEAALQATRAFELLDKDKSNTVHGVEWAGSKRLKPLFEKGGFDLAKPMNKDEFIQGYVRVGAAK